MSHRVTGERHTFAIDVVEQTPGVNHVQLRLFLGEEQLAFCGLVLFQGPDGPQVRSVAHVTNRFMAALHGTGDRAFVEGSLREMQAVLLAHGVQGPPS